MAKLKTLRDVFHEGVRDLYSAETQLVRALPKMAKAAGSPELKAAFQEHLAQTKEQVARLERVCETLEIKAKGKTCQAMKGLIEEGQEIITEGGEPEAKDAALIGAAQKVEHYEIAGYGTLAALAKALGEDEAKDLLGQTLDEEKQTDEKLTELAESGLNEAAMAGDDARDEPDEEMAAANGRRKTAAGKAGGGRRR